MSDRKGEPMSLLADDEPTASGKASGEWEARSCVDSQMKRKESEQQQQLWVIVSRGVFYG